MLLLEVAGGSAPEYGPLIAVSPKYPTSGLPMVPHPKRVEMPRREGRHAPSHARGPAPGEVGGRRLVLLAGVVPPIRVLGSVLTTWTTVPRALELSDFCQSNLGYKAGFPPI